MSGTTGSHRRSRGQAGRVFLWAAAVIVAVAIVRVLLRVLPAAAQTATTVVADDFEDGGLDGWIPFGGVTVANSTAAAESGIHSLLTSNRAAAYNGPSLDLTSNLVAGATYEVSIWAELVSGEAPAQLDVVMKQTPASGSATYDRFIAPMNVTDGAWVNLTGQYSFSGTMNDLLLYVESSDPTASFYIDNVVITEIAPPGQQDNSGIATTFEDNTTDGWLPRFNQTTLAVTNADAHSGAYSLVTTARQAAYVGPEISVANKMYSGSEYSVSLWAKLTPGEQPETLRVSLQVTLAGATTYHTVVPNIQVTADQWTELSVPNYAMAYSYDPGQAWLYVESASGTESFYIDDFQLTYIPPVQIQTDIPSIYQTLASYFPVGAAIDLADLSGPHAQLFIQHFDSITSENDMKWSATEPTEGNFTFGAADAEVQFAEANGAKIRGHNLVWSQQIPSWVFEEPDGSPMTPGNQEDRALLIQRMENHITNVVGHFKGEVYAWDVVNEPIDPSASDGLRHNTWYQIIGPEYIDLAFETAHQVDPDAELFVNDYDTTNPARAAALYNLVSGLLSRGAPINAVGHEMHSNIQYPSAQSIIDTVNMFSQLGVDQQITELDMSVYTDSVSSYLVIPPELLAEQGYRYRDYFNAFRQLKGEISGVTFWGLADDHTWLDTFPINRLDMPLLFDQGLQAKPAYWGVIDPTQLPGSALTGSIASKSGPANARVWMITMSNPGPGAAYATEITGFALNQTYGPACTPVVTSPSPYPVTLGDIAAGESADASFAIDFTGCSPLARFSLNAPFDSTAGTNTGAIVRDNEFR